MRTPACYISRLGSITLPHALLNLLKYRFFFQSIHTVKSIFPYTQTSGSGIAEANSVACAEGAGIEGEREDGK